MLFFLILVEPAFMGFAEAAPGNSDVQDSGMDAVRFIEEIGSSLPRRVEGFSGLFDEPLSFHTPDRTFMLYQNQDDGSGMARVRREIITKDGYVLSGIELKIHNPPYVSEVFISIRGDESGKCLSQKTIADVFMQGKPASARNEFIYSPVMKNFIRVVYEGHGGNDCAASVYLKYGTQGHE
ncbi:hypothetical protein [Novacetimonas pomaceti]|uniref:Uncharacterized protein n=1 Tax=Novacetimonas pomaceti TaxID=2021998 RepID=A0ABX5P5V9_9PROT|nr:hypothetical protein [Novacetimonas pomaceti]PYD49163.1 hypothetical protein C3920_00875 [Novacetimonas pomaceti]